ncbi:MAG: RDD family protein [Bacteroidota bacterium]
MENRIGFGPRLGAVLIDFVLIAVLSAIIATVFGVSGMAAGASSTSGDSADMATGMAAGFLDGIMASTIVMYIVSLVWYLLEGLVGYTVGKLIVGIQIGNEDGTHAGIGKLMPRYLIKNIASVFGILAMLTGVALFRQLGGILGLVIFIGFFFVLGTRKQGFHDMIAKTAVFRRSELK